MNEARSLDALSDQYRGDVIALVGTTTRVFDDCRLPNGALVEAPSHLPSYPALARDGLRCRPGLLLPIALLAMDALGRNLRSSLTRWLVDRAEAFRGDGFLRTAYAVNGRITEPGADLGGTVALRYALVTNESEPDFDDLIAHLETGIATLTRASSLNHDHADLHLATVGILAASPASQHHQPALTALTSAFRSATPGDEGHVAQRFAAVVEQAIDGDRDTARIAFFETLAAADSNGHFPERTDSPDSPSPFLLSHLLFLLAAHHTGELARIPRSGYTGPRRT